MRPPLNVYGKAPTEAALAELMGYVRAEDYGVVRKPEDVARIRRARATGLNPDAPVTLEAVDDTGDKERRAQAERNLEMIKENIVVLPGDLQAALYQWMHDALDLRIYR